MGSPIITNIVYDQPHRWPEFRFYLQQFFSSNIAEFQEKSVRTKPTGLGISLAYDIVTKGHDGALEVETKEGEGTTFIMKLPFETHG